jgi:hypothetical protein
MQRWRGFCKVMKNTRGCSARDDGKASTRRTSLALGGVLPRTSRSTSRLATSDWACDFLNAHGMMEHWAHYARARRIVVLLVRTTHPRTPTSWSQTRSSSSRAKCLSWTSTVRPDSISFVRIGSIPSDLSMKNTVPSGGFAANRFFDGTDLQTEVLSEVGNRIACFVSLVDG